MRGLLALVGSINATYSKGVPGCDCSAVSRDVDEVVEEISPQDVGLLDQVGRCSGRR